MMSFNKRTIGSRFQRTRFAGFERIDQLLVGQLAKALELYQI